MIEGMLNITFKSTTRLFYLVKCSLQFLGIWHTSPNFHGHRVVAELRSPNVCTTTIGEAIVTVFDYNTLLKVFYPRLVDREQCQKESNDGRYYVERTMFSCIPLVVCFSPKCKVLGVSFTCSVCSNDFIYTSDLLVVYVQDYKVASPPSASEWSRLRSEAV